MPGLCFEYDIVRGGFRFCLPHVAFTDPGLKLAHGLLTAVIDEDGQLSGLTSFWNDHGGLPIAFFPADVEPRLPSGEFPLTWPETVLDFLAVRLLPSCLEVDFDAKRRYGSQVELYKTDGYEVELTKKRVVAGWPVPGPLLPGEKRRRPLGMLARVRVPRGLVDRIVDTHKIVVEPIDIK